VNTRANGSSSREAVGPVGDRLRVLVLARSYPNDVFPTLGLWTEQPTVRLAQRCEMRVVSPIPWCPPLPEIGRLEQYARFRRVPATDRRYGVDIAHPRFVVGPGTSLYALEALTFERGIIRTIDRMHARDQFDLVHAHFIYPEGVVARRVAARLDIPFVVTEHAPWTGWLDRIGVARQAVPAARKAAAVMPVSTSVLHTVRNYAGESVRAKVIPVGVDTDVFRPLDERARSRDQILFAGFINYNKGVDVLLEAMARLAAAGSPGRLLIAGGSFYRNTRLQEDKLRSLATSLELGDRVRFLGRQPPHEIARLMAESAAVVLPSRAESFGAVLVEALASGTPVVATRCGGPEDIIEDSVGELVPVGDAEALADALQRVLAQPQKYPVDKLRAHAVTRFGWDGIVDRIHDVYIDAVAPGRSAGRLSARD
jgi:teichuronic acid biosynthesis glycosyltransferase TuaC